MAVERRVSITLVFFILLLGGFIAINLAMVGPYLLTVLMGAILSILTMPLFSRLRRRGFGPRASALTVILTIAVLVFGPLGWFATSAIKQGIAVGQKVSEQGISLERVTEAASKWGPARSVLGNSAEMQQKVRQQARTAGTRATGVLLGILGAIPDLVLHLALALITCYFFLLDGRRFLSWLQDKLPLDRDVRAQLYGSFRDTAVSTTWATLAAAGTQAALMFVSYLVLGVPGAFLAAGATFIFAWIPMVGSTPIWVVGAAVLYWGQGSLTKALLMVGLGVITGLADNFVRPWVLKGRGEMHPLVALVAIFGGIQMFGLFGVFFGPILAAVMLALLNVWPTVARRFHLVAGTPENLAPDAPKDSEKAARRRVG